MGRRVAILGGGPNGLTAACYLARAGRDVTVFEARDVLGGLAASEEFHPGFRAPGLHHDTSTISPRVLRDLDLERHGLEWHARRPPILFAEEDGPGLLVGADGDAVRAQLSERDAERYTAYEKFHAKIAGVLESLVANPPPDAADPNVLELAARAVGLRRLGKRDMLEFLRIAPMCVADWLNEWFENDRLKAGLAGHGVFSAFLGPWSAGTNMNLLLWEHGARVHVPGGGAKWIAALTACARSAGVELVTGARANAILCSGGTVEGVEFESGERHAFDTVVSTLDPKSTFCLTERVPQRLAEHVGIWRCAGTTAVLRLAIRGDACRFASRPDEAIARARTGDTIDHVEKAFDALKYGEFSERPILDVFVPSFEDPSLCPESASVVSVHVHFAPYALRAGWSDEQKAALYDRAIAELTRVAPEITARIAGHELLTPLDIEQRYGVTGGHLHHGDHALDQRFLRPTPETARYATPIPGLYLAGSGSHPGGGLTGEPARLCADSLP